MERNRVVLVDVNDTELGTADKIQAHEKGLLHRAFSIFVVREINGVKQILLQQRALTKYHCAGLWSNTCCSHPQSGENLKQSAINRLNEELGFTVNSLTWVDSHCYKAKLSNDLIEHEFDHLFVKQLSKQELKILQIRPNPAEVHAIDWLSIKQIELELKNTANKFTPWFKDTFYKILEKL